MRETGVVRFQLGDDPASAEIAKQYIGIARTQLGITKNLMRLGGLGQLTRRVVLPDGAIIACQSVLGQDTVNITPPVVPSQVLANPSPEKVKIQLPVIWWIAGYQVISTFSKPTVWTQQGATLLPDGGFGADGEATAIIMSGGTVIAVVGWLNNSSYDEVAWWTPNSDGTWTLHMAGTTWDNFYPLGRVFSAAALTWDFGSAQPTVATPPTISSRNPTPHKVRVAVQEWQQFTSTGFGTLTVPGMLVLEIDDGVGPVFTVGKWGGQASETDVDTSKTLDEWMSFIAANSPDIADYPSPTPSSVTYAAVYGPFDVSIALEGTTYSAGPTSLVLSGSPDQMFAEVAGMNSTPSTHLTLTAPLVTQTNNPVSWVSIDEQWCAGHEAEGYYYATGTGVQFAAQSTAFRHSASTGTQYLSNPGELAQPSTQSPWIGTNGTVFDDIADVLNPGPLIEARWTPALDVIQPSGAFFPDGVSTAGTAMCGGTNDTGRPWVWSESGGFTVLPIPADCNYGEALHTADDGTAIGFVDSVSDEWVVLWLNGEIALQLEDSNLWFNDVATGSGEIELDA